MSGEAWVVRPELEIDDATLVVRTREGDPAAFEALVRRYKRRIYRLAAAVAAESGLVVDTVAVYTPTST